MYRWGIVQEVRLVPVPGVKVQFPEDDVVSGWLPVLQLLTFGAKVSALPRKGGLVAVLPGDDPTDGLVLGGVFNAQDKPSSAASLAAVVVELEGGLQLVMDPTAKSVAIKGADLVDLQAGTKIHLAAPTIALEGAVDVKGSGNVSGDWLAKGNTSAHHTHPVSGATAGRGEP